MNVVPQHCIDKFKKDFNFEPCLVHIELESFDKIEKLTSKSRTIWFSSIFRHNGVFIKEKFVEYDAMGIYIYISRDEDSQITNVTFLTTIDRQSVSEFTIHNLNKTK
jgi:hypothetical protein